MLPKEDFAVPPSFLLPACIPKVILDYLEGYIRDQEHGLPPMKEIQQQWEVDSSLGFFHHL